MSEADVESIIRQGVDLHDLVRAMIINSKYTLSQINEVRRLVKVKTQKETSRITGIPIGSVRYIAERRRWGWLKEEGDCKGKRKR